MNDVDLLPVDLMNKSLSKKEIVLNYDVVHEAIDIITFKNWAILGWEAWVKYKWKIRSSIALCNRDCSRRS